MSFEFAMSIKVYQQTFNKQQLKNSRSNTRITNKIRKNWLMRTQNLGITHLLSWNGSKWLSFFRNQQLLCWKRSSFFHMSSAEWFLPNFGIPNFDLSTFKERKRYQHAAELEKKVYTSTGGTGGGHSSEERLLTLFIIDFYVRLRLFSSAVETVLAWRWQVHPVLGFKCICRDEEVRRRTVLVVTSIICVCPCSEWCCYRNSAWWKCPTVQFTKESPLEVLISWEGVVIDSIIVYSVVELVVSGNFSERNSAGSHICILLTYVPLGSNMWDTSLLNS